MKISISPAPGCTLLLLALPACSSSGPDGADTGDALAFSALKVGAVWTYNNTDLNAVGGPKETTVTKEITGCEAITIVDCATEEMHEYNAYVQQTTGGAANPDDANKLYIVAAPEGVVRVKQDVVELGTFDHYITYSPFFMRLSHGPYDAGRREDFPHQRCEYSASDEVLLAETTRRYRHEVIASDEQVEVEQGSYDGVLHMQRTDLGDNDIKEFWYVRDVGKVLEKGYVEGTLVGEEELSDFVEGTESCE